MSRNVVALVVVLVAAVAVSLSFLKPKGSGEVLKIGALLPMTGDLQAYGEACLLGAQLAITEVNNQGGVLGAPVELTIADTRTDPRPGVEAAQRLVEMDKVSAILGALSSSVTIAVAETVTGPAGVPQISSASISPEVARVRDNDTLFRTAPTNAVQGLALAQVTQEKGIGSVAVIFINNDYGKEISDGFTAAFTALGGRVTQSVPFEPNRSAYRGELQLAATGGADHLVVIAYPDNGGTLILKEALEEGIFGKFILTDSMKSKSVIDSVGAENLKDTFGTAPENIGVESDSFKELYKMTYNDLPPNPHIDNTFDAVMLLALATEKANTTKSVNIRDALRSVANPPGEPVGPRDFAKAKDLIAAGEDIDYQGASGPLNFGDHGDVKGTYAHWEIENGAFVTIRVFEP